jgi:nitrogen regulatory protein PII-like uncharacterized protein
MFVIIMLLANAVGSPIAAGQYKAQYATLALCEAARPSVVAEIQAAVEASRPGFKVADSKCVSEEALNKVNDRTHEKLNDERFGIRHA